MYSRVTFLEQLKDHFDISPKESSTFGQDLGPPVCYQLSFKPDISIHIYLDRNDQNCQYTIILDGRSLNITCFNKL